MTRSEAVGQIEKIISNYDSFTKSVNTLVSQVGELSTSINGINYGSILHETTINLINTGLSKINEDITKINNACTSVVNTAKNDANEKIKEIVDSYNASISDDPDAVKLSYQTVTGEVIAADVAIATVASGTLDTSSPKTETPVETPTDVPDITTPIIETPTEAVPIEETPVEETQDTNTDTSGGNTNYGGNNYSYSGGSYTPEEPTNNYETIKNALDYYFAHSSTEKLNSSSIDGWDTYITEFLKENNLSTYVKNIRIENGVVICTLVNGREYKYENVTGIVDLLKKLQISVTKSGEGEGINA